MAEYGQPPGLQYYLTLKIGGVSYNPLNVKSLVIKEWIHNILPTIEITFADDGYLFERSPLQDQQDIEVVLGKTEDDENMLSLTFSMSDYQIGIIGDNRKSIVLVVGYLKVRGMYTLKDKSYPRRNSSDVLAQIASDAGLPFTNPHNIVPSDNMTWIQDSQSDMTFVRHVLRRAYMPDDTLFFYANTDSEFVLTSLRSEINEKYFATAKFDVKKYELNVVDTSDIDDTIWFGGYSVVNYSGYVNKTIGYGFEYNYYDLEHPQNNEVRYSDIKALTELSFRNANMVGKAVVKRHSCDYNSANIYGTKYFESMLRNRFLKENFFANSLVLNVNSLSRVSLMDTIDVHIPSLFTENESNEVASGFYLVGGIQHEVSYGGIYKKKLAVGRNGMNKSSDKLDYVVEDFGKQFEVGF